ncbi:hypothetical protein KA057_01995 [Candidatus Gracilibacteria bacterium]|nr:hypothetical protein [Candidatus Gracilibacteria bacterium]
MPTITIDHITHYTNELIAVRNQIAFFTQKIDELKEKRDMTQKTLIDAMKSNNLKSWKTNDNSFSLVSKMDTRIVDEEQAIKDIKARKLEGLVYEKIDTLRFKQIANILLKQKGELFFGTESVTTEYLSIRSLTKDDATIV